MNRNRLWRVQKICTLAPQRARTALKIHPDPDAAAVAVLALVSCLQQLTLLPRPLVGLGHQSAAAGPRSRCRAGLVVAHLIGPSQSLSPAQSPVFDACLGVCRSLDARHCGSLAAAGKVPGVAATCAGARACWSGTLSTSRSWAACCSRRLRTPAGQADLIEGRCGGLGAFHLARARGADSDPTSPKHTRRATSPPPSHTRERPSPSPSPHPPPPPTLTLTSPSPSPSPWL